MEKESLRVLLSEGAVFDGELRFRGTARIRGKLKGHITGSGYLIVEAGAQVIADIEVDRLLLLGEFSGRAKIRKAAVMEPPAHFSGEIYSPSLSIKEGVFFEGVSKKLTQFK